MNCYYSDELIQRFLTLAAFSRLRIGRLQGDKSFVLNTRRAIVGSIEAYANH